MYIIVSRSLAGTGDYLQKLEKAVDEESIAGARMGMRPHTLSRERIETAEERRQLEADCLIALGGGSLIDSGKGAILLSTCLFTRCRDSIEIDHLRSPYSSTMPPS